MSASTPTPPPRRPANAGKRYPPQILTGEEVLALMRACSVRAPTGLRNRALITLLYRGGLRVSEALALRPRDVEAVSDAVRILRGKGGRHRTIWLDVEAMSVIDRWLEPRRELVGRRAAPLICTLQGGPLDASYVRKLLKRLARKAGIEKHVHPHGLRHTLAVELMLEGQHAAAIQAQLGHASLHTTAVYLRGLPPVELLAGVRARRWQGSEEL